MPTYEISKPFYNPLEEIRIKIARTKKELDKKNAQRLTK